MPVWTSPSRGSECDKALSNAHAALLRWMHRVAPKVLADSAATNPTGPIADTAGCRLLAGGEAPPAWLGDLRAFGPLVTGIGICRDVCASAVCTGKAHRTRALTCSVVGTLDAVGCAGMLPAQLSRSCAHELTHTLRKSMAASSSGEHGATEKSMMSSWALTAGGAVGGEGLQTGGAFAVAAMLACATLLAFTLLVSYVRLTRAGRGLFCRAAAADEEASCQRGVPIQRVRLSP